MARTSFSRYIWLIEIIYKNQALSFDEINKKWKNSPLSNGNDLPLRTFHNHRAAIEDIFGIEIRCNKEYKYYINGIEELQNGGVKEWLINNFTISNLLSESEALRERILLENIPSGQKHLNDIIKAMRDGKSLIMNYQPFWHENPYQIEIEPYFVKLFKQIWYLIGRNPDNDKIKIYALDRIISIQSSNNDFVVPDDFHPQEYFLHNYGVIREDIPPQTIEIKVFGMQVNYWRALPFHHSQKEIETTNQYSVFSLFLSPSFDFIRAILSQAADVEIIKPLSLRNEIRELLGKMNNMYQ